MRSNSEPGRRAFRRNTQQNIPQIALVNGRIEPRGGLALGSMLRKECR